MKKLLPLLCALPLQAVELTPYLPPAWQPDVYADYLFQYQDRIETPLGDFNLSNPINNATFGVDLTVWPRWNGQLDVLFSSAPAADINFSYLATRLTGRYLLFDEADGAWVTSGVDLSLFAVRSSFLKATNIWFHGNFNGELGASVGRECLYHDEWWLRLWSYAGFGIANRGNPWWHYVGELQLKPCYNIEVCPMAELVYGMGSNNINPAEPFPGYAGINHEFVNVGLSLRHESLCYGKFELNGWYNVHAHNFPEDYYGVGLTWSYAIGI